jgi:hypothetical protein
MVASVYLLRGRVKGILLNSQRTQDYAIVHDLAPFLGARDSIVLKGSEQ